MPSERPRALVVGAGPIGSFLAAALQQGGADVTLHGRGAGFQGLVREQAVRIATRGDAAPPRRVPLACVSTLPPAGGWNLLVLAVKAQDLGAAAQLCKAHAREAITLLPQNGLPWWQFLGQGGTPLHLASVDPGGLCADALPLQRLAGCVVTKGVGFDAEGTLVEACVASDRFTLGDVVAGSGAAALPAAWLERGGLPVVRSDDIRGEKWRKLLVNVAFNPLGALSHLGFGEVLDEPAGAELAQGLMAEALRIASACGLESAIDPAAAMQRARASRHHKTSMLQDVEAGRPLETAAIVGVLLELAARHRLQVPALQTVHACLRLLDRSLAKGPIRLQPVPC